MKSLRDFIIEQREQTISEAKDRIEVRIEVKDIEGSDEFLEKLKSALSEKDIYNEKIDNGLKFALQGEDTEKYKSIVDILKGWEKGQEKLEGAISKVEEWISKSEEEKASKEEEEKKKKEEE